MRDERMSSIESFDETGLAPEHYIWEGGTKECEVVKRTIHTRREGRKEEGQRGRERKWYGGVRACNPNEYLISAYLTPAKVQSDGMAGSLP